MNFVFDSLEKAGTMPKAQLDRIRQMIASGESGLRPRRRSVDGAAPAAVEGAAGRGRGDRWRSRRGPGRRRGAAAKAARRTFSDMLNAFPGGAQEFGELLRPPGQRGGRGGGGGFGGLFGGGGGRGIRRRS